MVSTKRIYEVYSFYIYNESGNTQESINRYNILRERLERILKATKLRSIQLAMGSSGLPFQFTIARMSHDDFEEFVDTNVTGKRRKELYKKYGDE